MSEGVTRRIGKDSLRTTAFGAATRVAPLASTVAIAAFYGAGANLDIYYLALMLPVFLAGIIGMAISTVFVPVLVEARKSDARAYPTLLGSLLLWTLGAALALTLVYVIVSPLAMKLVSRGYDDAQRQTAVRLARYLSPAILLVTLRSYLTAVCHAHQRFTAPALTNALTPATMVVFIAVLSDRAGMLALVAGNVVGYAVEVMALALSMRLGNGPRFALSRRHDPRTLDILRLASPQILSGTVLRINPIIDRSMASALGAGAVSALVYAERMQSVPQQILSLGFFNVVLSHWSSAKIDAGVGQVGASLVRVTRVMAAVLVPATLVAVVFRHALVSLVLQRGAFDAGDTARIAPVFAVYALQLLPMIVSLVYVRALLVMKETVLLMRVGLFNAVSNVSLNALFVYVLGLGVAGIALSTVITSWMVALLFLRALTERLGYVPLWTPAAPAATPRVAILIKRFSRGEVFGGAEAFAWRLARGLEKSGHVVSIVSARMRRDWPRAERHAAIAITRLPHPRVRVLGSLVYNVLLFARLIATRRDYDVVFVTFAGLDAVTAAIARTVTRRPVVCKIASSGSNGDIGQIRRRWHAPLTLRLLRSIDTFVALNDEVERDLRAIGVPEERIARVANGVDTDAFAPVPPVDRDDKPFRIVGVGRLSRQKNWETLLRALPALRRPWQCTIAGRGDDRASLASLAGELGIADRVQFAGETHDVRGLLHAADAFVLPSLWEGASNALLEAQSCGVPCVATGIPGNDDIIEHGICGLLFAPGDFSTLAAHLQSLADDPAFRRRLGHAARRNAVDRYSLDSIVRAYAGVFAQLTVVALPTPVVASHAPEEEPCPVVQ